jgi:hypothetical protein
MFHFATYFDRNYLSRGLVLYHSIKENLDDFELYVLCLDQYTLQYFRQGANNFPEIKIISLEEIESEDRELEFSKRNRSLIEYYFTLSPCLPLYLLQKYQLSHICSLDADIMFYSSPKPLFDYLNAYSIVITPHKFSKQIVSFEEYGTYNVSFQIFKNDKTGLNCLQKWRKQCIEWCFDILDAKNNRYADQKYLDEWLCLYPNKVKPLDDDISGLAPWNINNFSLTYKNKTFFSNRQKLIFYHFHSFKILASNWASHAFSKYKVIKQPVLDSLYLLYWKKVEYYNLLQGLGKDKTKRTDFAKSLTTQLYYSVHVYFKLLNIHLIHINYAKLPYALKKIISRIYG